MQKNRGDNAVNQARNFKTTDSFALKWSLTAIVISVIISLGILFATNAEEFMGLVNSAHIGKLVNNVRMSPPSFPFFGGRQNILLLGVDANGNEADPFKGARSDSIIVISIDPRSKTANAISIPRDSKVPIAGNHEIDKINAAHALGGPKLTIDTIENVFGIKINHYVAISYKGIRSFVDAVGGVPVNVEKRMHYNDYSGNLHINLYPGYQVLNPDQAIGYLRFRHDAIGDIGRMKRQQWFVKGLIKKMQSPEILPRTPQILQAASTYIRTDMNFYELSQLAGLAKSINLDDVQTATLPGKPSEHGYISYWILDVDKSQEIIDRLIYREESGIETPLKVSLLYSRDYNGNLDGIRSSILQSGYTINCETSARAPHTQVIAHSSLGTFKSFKALRSKIPALKSAQFTVEPQNQLCGESDLSIVLSSDN